MTIIDTFLDFAIIHVNKKYSTKDDFLERAKRFNEHECFERNRPESCNSYADYITMKENNLVKAAKIYQKNCVKNKFAKSCFNYGNLRMGAYKLMLKPGERLRYPEINPSVGLDYFRLGCDYGYPGACYNAGVILTIGIMGTKESGMSPEFYKTPTTTKPPKIVTTENGVSIILPADFEANLHNIKNHSPNVVEEILELFKKGCDNEYKESCLNAAKLYAYGYKGAGVENKPDYEQAYVYCEIGCKFGNQDLCFMGHDLIVSGRVASRSIQDAKDLVILAEKSDRQSTPSF